MPVWPSGATLGDIVGVPDWAHIPAYEPPRDVRAGGAEWRPTTTPDLRKQRNGAGTQPAATQRPAHDSASTHPAPAAGERPTGDVGSEVGRKDGLIPAPPLNGFNLGPVRFHLYGLLIGAGGWGAYRMFTSNVARLGVDTAKLGGLLIPTAIATAVGARLYHVASDWDLYKDHPENIPKVWEGGLGIYGGVGAGMATAAFLAHRSGLPVLGLLDSAVAGLALAQAIGRWGNYFNQELYGSPTDLPWGLQVDPEHRPAQYADRNSFQPTFLYESAYDLSLAGGLWMLGKTWTNRPPGMLLALYVAGYAAGRFGMEFLRTDEHHTILGMRQNQFISGALFAAGAGAALLLHATFKPPLG
jgi:prolipoprotein diacylglyceryl transferase